jgi:basic membrane protein A and related proteins
MKLRRSVLPLVVAALLAAACGGEDPTAPVGDETDDTAATDDADDTDTDTDSDAGEAGDDAAEGDDEVLRVAFVYVGPVGDAGWTFRHDAGRQDLEEALGDRVETTFLESVPEGAESERVFEDLARQGNDLIFGTSFGYGDQMVAVSEQYPDVVFEHATGYQTTDNLGTYFGAVEETRYLEGMAAGAATESDQIGYVAAFPIPEVVRGINAYTLGVREVNPDATVQVIWTSTWYDPEVEGQAAESLIDAGADVIGMHQDSPAPGQAAEEAGAKWTGYHSDMEEFAPSAWLTASVWDWGPYYISTAESVLDGTWESREYYGNMADGIFDLAPFGESVEQDTQDEIAARRQEILDGDFAPFTGPINDQDGDERVSDGESMDLGELLSFDWFVEGVIGQIE